MNVLVCGGAGYVGSHMTRLLRERGHSPIVLDNLSTGHRQACRGELEVVDVLDPTALERVFARHSIDLVMHFCAKSIVAESVNDPYDYYTNNVVGSLNLLTAMRRHNVDRIVFSSTAAVYGAPEQSIIDESHKVAPINPYGASKASAEHILADAAQAYRLRSVSFRYFNAAGASADGTLGEAHDPETHLIPNVLRAARGDGPPLRVFGDDFPTADGTCVRDYVHVEDIAEAHLLAIQFMDRHEGAHVFNLGNEAGSSVLDVIHTARIVTGKAIAYEVVGRRNGDPAILVASSRKAEAVLGWRPKYRPLDRIIETAWTWHRNKRF